MTNSVSSGGEDQDASISTKPYLLRAIYQWALDNGFTPQVLVATDDDEVIVPRQFVKDNQIVLNLHPQSVTGLEIGKDYLWFSARFSGKAMEITLPVSAVMAIYARENGQGIVFQESSTGITPPPGPLSGGDTAGSDNQDKKQGKNAHLKLVK